MKRRGTDIPDFTAFDSSSDHEPDEDLSTVILAKAAWATSSRLLPETSSYPRPPSKREASLDMKENVAEGPPKKRSKLSSPLSLGPENPLPAANSPALACGQQPPRSVTAPTQLAEEISDLPMHKATSSRRNKAVPTRLSVETLLSRTSSLIAAGKIKPTNNPEQNASSSTVILPTSGSSENQGRSPSLLEPASTKSTVFTTGGTCSDLTIPMRASPEPMPASRASSSTGATSVEGSDHYGDEDIDDDWLMPRARWLRIQERKAEEKAEKRSASTSSEKDVGLAPPATPPINQPPSSSSVPLPLMASASLTKAEYAALRVPLFEMTRTSIRRKRRFIFKDNDYPDLATRATMPTAPITVGRATIQTNQGAAAREKIIEKPKPVEAPSGPLPGTIITVTLENGKTKRRKVGGDPNANRPIKIHPFPVKPTGWRAKAKDPIKEGRRLTNNMSYPQYIDWIAEHGPIIEDGGRSARFAEMEIFLLFSDQHKLQEQHRGNIDFLYRNGAGIQRDFDPEQVTHVLVHGYSEKHGPLIARGLGYESILDVPLTIPILSLNGWLYNHITTYRKDPFFNLVFFDMFRDRMFQHTQSRTTSKPDGGPRSRSASISSNRRRSRRDDSDSHDTSSEDEQELAPPSSLSITLPSSSVAPEALMGTSKPSEIAINSATENRVAAESHGSDLAHDFLSTKLKHSRSNDDASSDEPETMVKGTAGSDEIDDADDDYDEPGAVSTRDFICCQPGRIREAGPNDALADALKLMHDMYESLPDIDAKWRQFATRKAISAIRNCKHPIKSIKDMQNIRGVGAKTQKKILDFLKTKKITLLENLKNDPQLRTIMEFKGIYGVGSQTAKEWWNRGLRTLDDVRSRKDGVNLNENQELGLRYYDDINARMPREEAKEIFEQVKAEALELDPKLLIEAMGSYRRGKKDCGDLDILISRPTNDGRDHEGLLDDLLMVLHQKKIILHDLALPKPTDRLESKYMGLAASTDPNHKVRRLDILTIPCHQWGAALLYFTGDDIFNRSMRLLARKQGYSLNQRGLFAGVVRNSKGIKLNNGTIICSATEREIFDKLGVPWQEPHERKRG